MDPQANKDEEGITPATPQTVISPSNSGAGSAPDSVSDSSSPDVSSPSPSLDPTPVNTEAASPTPFANSEPSPQVSEPALSQAPEAPQAQTPESQGVVSSSGEIGVPPAVPFTVDKSSKRNKKPLIIGLIVALLLIGGVAAAYFGYWMNPSVVYSQALSNTAKGYDQVIDYVDKQAAQPQKGSIVTGSYTVKGPSYSVDGKINFKGDNKNGELTFDAGIAGNRIDVDAIFIDSGGTSPDIYAKVKGLDSLGVLSGSAQTAGALGQLNDKWIFVDHTLFDSLQAATTGNAKADKAKQPTRQQVLDEAKAFGKVNQDYLFSTDSDKAVMKVTKKYGKESVDGHSTYHYQVALQKDNVKKYIKAQQTALNSSQLGAWIKQNDYQAAVDAYFASTLKSADSIKDSDTFDLWADTTQRVIYKVRFSDDSNPAVNYVDLGMGYKGGKEYPFFITFNSKDGSGAVNTTLKLTVNTSTNVSTLDFKLNTTGASKTSATANLVFKPTDATIKIGRPAGAIPISKVFEALGYGDLYNMYVGQLQATAASGGVLTKSSLN